MEAEAIMATENILMEKHSEKMILGAAMLYPEIAESIVGEFSLEEFTENAHAVIFEAISELIKGGKHSDVVQVAERLREKGKLGVAGGRAYLTLLVIRCCRKDQLFEYAATIKNAKELRKPCAISEMYEAIRDTCNELTALIFVHCHPTCIKKGTALGRKDEADDKVKKVKLLISELWNMFEDAREKEDEE